MITSPEKIWELNYTCKLYKYPVCYRINWIRYRQVCWPGYTTTSPMSDSGLSNEFKKIRKGHTKLLGKLNINKIWM